jgi:hypothetical protein
MASHFYSIPVGGGISPANVTKSTSTTGGSVLEVRIDDGATGMNKMTAMLALKAIEAYITTDSALP